MGGSSAGATGGSNERTLSVANLPEHDHPISISSGGDHSHMASSANGWSARSHPLGPQQGHQAAGLVLALSTIM
jgi:microcystin-dependent protein